MPEPVELLSLNGGEEGGQVRGTPNLKLSFHKEDCLPCPLWKRCTRAKTGARQLTICPQEPVEALQTARKRQQTEAFQELYRQRSGIEGTKSQGVRKMGFCRSRHIGLSRTHLQHVAPAAAINVVRAANWLAGEIPDPTRVSPFKMRTAA